MVSSSKEESASDGQNSSGDPTESSSKSLFSDGEKVLAYHGPRIYEAKVQKAEFRKKEWRYFVHYLGWSKKANEFHVHQLMQSHICFWEIICHISTRGCDSKRWTEHASLTKSSNIAYSWDEWVGMDRLMKYNEENILKQQALDKKVGVDKNTKSGRSVQTKPKSSADAKVDKEEVKNNVAKGKKRKADSGTEKDNPAAEKLIKIQIPPVLKKQLVDDWEFITQQDKLVKLPRSPCVDDVFTKYLEYRSKKDGLMTDALGEILNGLRSYFNKALPVILLYEKEHQQYRDVISESVFPSSIYGAEHLLRLFVKLPELLAHVNIEEETLVRLQQKLLEFLKFLQKNESTFFLPTYDGPNVTDGGSKKKDD